MTFKQQLEADLDVFVNESEFAYGAVFSGTGETVSVLLDKDQEPDTGRFVDLLTAKSADIDGVKPGDTFTLNDTGDVYAVAASSPVMTGDGITMVRVDKV